MALNKWWILSLLFSSLTVHAADTVGNGGDAVVCKNTQGQISSIEILDLYEGREQHHLDFNLGAADLTVEQKVELALTRLEGVDGLRTKYMRDEVALFNRSVEYKPGITLVDIPDSNHEYLPAGCEIQQIAIQKESQFSGEKIYTISKDLWDHLNSDNKASLVLHEVLYRVAIRLGHKNSVVTRYLNSWISSKNFESVAIGDYRDFILKNNLFINYSQIDLSLDKARTIFFKNFNFVKAAMLTEAPSYIFLEGKKILLSPLSIVTFYKSGAIRRFSNAEDFDYKGYRVRKGETTLYESGVLNSFSNRDPISFTDASNNKIILRGDGWISFHPSGSLRFGYVHGHTKVKLLNQEVDLMDQSGLLVSPSGHLQDILISQKEFEFKVNGINFIITARAPATYLRIELFESGIPRKSDDGIKLDSAKWDVPFQNGKVSIRRGSPVTLNPSGKLKWTIGDNCWLLLQGKRQICNYIWFYESGSVESVKLKNENIAFRFHDQDMQIGGLLSFYESGKVKYFSPKRGTIITEVAPDGQIWKWERERAIEIVTVSENGRILDGELSEGVSIDVNGRRVNLAKDRYVSLHPNGVLRSGGLVGSLEESIGSKVYTVVDSVMFDEKGVLTYGQLSQEELVMAQSGKWVKTDYLKLDSDRLQIEDLPEWLNRVGREELEEK